MVGDVRRQMSLVGRLGDWMGTGGRRPGAGRGAQMAVLTRGCGTAPPAPTSAHSRYRRRAFPPDQRAGCLGRRKGASRPFGIGLRPTLPPTSGTRIGRVVVGAGERGRAERLRVGGLVCAGSPGPGDRRPEGRSTPGGRRDARRQARRRRRRPGVWPAAALAGRDPVPPRRDLRAAHPGPRSRQQPVLREPGLPGGPARLRAAVPHRDDAGDHPRVGRA
jgi:hypothetical protein